MIVYGSPLSPFVRKTLAYCTEKGLTVQSDPIGFGSQDPDFLAASPFRKIPGFKDGDFSISDSTAIIAYLEAKHPSPALLPSGPASRARVIWFEEFADTILSAVVGKIFFNRIVAPKFLGREGDMAVADQGETVDLPPLLDYLEGQIPASGFLVDDQLTLADVAVASPFVNFEHAGFKPNPTTHSKLVAYLAAILSRPSFAAVVAKEKQILGG